MTIELAAYVMDVFDASFDAGVDLVLCGHGFSVILRNILAISFFKVVASASLKVSLGYFRLG